MNRIIICVEYDGTDYSGWQVQPDRSTVQGELNKAVYKAFGNKWSVVGAGRTDTGVHSSGQIAHFDYDEINVPRHKVRLAINHKLPRNIRVKRLWFATIPFHARFDANLREYRYRFTRHPSIFNNRYIAFFPFQLDISLLKASADVFIGEHSFYSFSKNHSSNGDYVCKIDKCC